MLWCWVVGKAWFGSIMTCVEVMKQCEANSTFIVENIVPFHPMGACCTGLKARHGDQPGVQCVFMKTSIADFNLIAISYAWSQKDVSYFISSCGLTDASPIRYKSKFDNEWGNTNF